jgi:hypothetical protein
MLDLPHGGRSDSMRPIHLLSLLAVAVLAFGCCAHAQQGSRPPKPPKAPKAPEPPAAVQPAVPPAPPPAAVAEEQPFPIWNIKEAGQTSNDADDLAQEKALKEIRSFLARQSPPIRWQPDLAWVKDQKQPLLTNRVVDEQDLPDSGLHAYFVSYDVKLTQQAYRKILENDRQLTMQERQLLLGKVLAALVAVFTAFAGYYRLEEATKGYYTNWLRLGALGLVAAVGGALFLIS